LGICAHLRRRLGIPAFREPRPGVNPAGDIVDDFVIDETDRVVNVENAPSPAATAALNIGRLVVDRLAPRFS
jgi:L-2-hydroxyglutarate oxidase LhgO